MELLMADTMDMWKVDLLALNMVDCWVDMSVVLKDMLRVEKLVGSSDSFEVENWE